MFRGLRIYHQKKSDQPNLIQGQNGDLWSTCLRSLYIGHISNGVKVSSFNGDVWKDEEAYSELLKIVCGINSPMVGETEIFGQFKDFVEQTTVNNKGHWILSQLMDTLIRDVKLIRQRFLIGLGGQSYGSLIRKKIDIKGGITFVGAGRLVKDICPWLEKMNLSIHVLCRDVKKVKEDKFYSDKANICQFSDSKIDSNCKNLLITAPIPSYKIHELLNRSEYFNGFIFDLRGECDKDPIAINKNVITLTELFSEIEANRSTTAAAVNLALDFIEKRVQSLATEVKIRPFGWDDLCA